MGRGDAKKSVMNGEHPHLVKQYIDAQCATHAAAVKQAEEYAAITAAINMPRGYSLVIDGDNICIHGPYDDNLAQRVRRQKGYWGSAGNSSVRDCWIVSLSKAKSLKRIIASWIKFKDVEKKQRWALEEKRNAEKRMQDQKRAADRRASEQKQAKAKAGRIKVAAGRYQIGDELRGRMITGFGSCWTETERTYQQSDSAPKMEGQLWEPCQCGNEPVYMPLHKCERCWPGAQVIETPVSVCYAYFE